MRMAAAIVGAFWCIGDGDGRRPAGRRAPGAGWMAAKYLWCGARQTLSSTSHKPTHAPAKNDE